MDVPKKVLADSSFLIALLNKGDAHHKSALEHFNFLVEKGVKFFLSPIVEAELTEDLQAADLPLLSSLKRLTFTFRDGDLASSYRQKKHEKNGASRDCVKDDIKILAQAVINEMDALITADGKAISSIFEMLHPSAENHLCYIDITKNCKDTFEVNPTLFEEGEGAH